MPITKSPTGITFAVDDVVPETEALATCKPLEAVRALLDAPASPFAGDESALGNPTHGRIESCWNYSLDCVAGVTHHPLIAAADRAFADHRPLSLSPDVIWLTLVQGFAQHIRLDPERYRHLLVQHAGKKTLVVERDDIHRGSPENPWAEIIADFAGLARREVGPFAEQLECDFSTTGPVERTVSQIALLDAVRPYFDYFLIGVCGIPAITLEGTPEDWQRLRAKVELFAPFDLDWWLAELRPIADQFARAASGDINLNHWRRIYKIRQAYAATMINGWLGKLFPYLDDNQRNPLLDPQVEAEIQKLEHEETLRTNKDTFSRSAPGITASKLPRGLSQVPFVYQDRGGKRAMDWIGGSIAVTQADDLTLRPVLGWAVREGGPIEQALLQVAAHQTKPARDNVRECAHELHRTVRAHYIPSDVLRFYSVLHEATLHPGTQEECRIIPLSDWCVAKYADPWIPSNSGEDAHLRIAERNDGTEFLIRLHSPGEFDTGSVFLGQRNGTAIPRTGEKLAKSFSEFLLQMAAGDSPGRVA